MKPTISPLPSSAAQCVPFAQATPKQVSQAMDTTRQALGEQFVLLLKTTWVNVFRTLQPDLWVTLDTVSLDAHDLARVAHHLDTLPAVVDARAGHGPRKLYYIRQPMNCSGEVLRALGELEANPRAGDPAVFQLVTGMVRRHAEAEEFYWAKVPDPREADGADPHQARAALLARVEALGRARGGPDAT